MLKEGSCDICDRFKAQIICSDCPKMKNFCEECFIKSHTSIQRKSHKAEFLKEQFQDTLFCETHKEKKVEAICQKCLIPICSGCFPNHKDHNTVSLLEYPKKMSPQIESTMKSLQNEILNIEKIKIGSISTEKSIDEGLETFKKYIQNTLQQLEASLAKKKEEILLVIQNSENDTFGGLKSLASKFEILNGNLNINKNSLAGLTKSQTSGSKCWQLLQKVTQNLDKIKFEISECENTVTNLVNKKIIYPQLNSVPLSEEISNLSIQFNETAQSENNNDIRYFCKKYSGKMIEKDKRKKIKSEINLLKFYENPSWTKKIKQRSSTPCSIVFEDGVTKKIYSYYGVLNQNTLEEFNNIDDFFANHNSRTIKIETGFDGNYTIAQGEYLIHIISNSSRIGKTSLEDGKLIESYYLNKVYFGDTTSFKCPVGNNSISLFNDSKNQIQYIMYQKLKKNRASISELRCFPKFVFGRTWEIPFDKRFIAFCLIYDNVVYLGFNSLECKFTKAFHLIDHSLQDININFNGGKEILSVTYIPEESAFISVNPKKIYRCHATN